MKIIALLLLVFAPLMAQYVPTPNPGDPIKIAAGGGGGSGTVTSVTINGTASQITATGTCTGTTTITCTLSLPSALVLPGTIDGLTITTTTGTLTIAAAKVFTVNNTVTITGTDGSTLNIGAGGTLGSNAFNSTAFVPTTTTVAGHALSSNVSIACADLTNASAACSSLNNLSLTGTPTAPTPAATDNSTTIPTTAYVTTAITNAVNAAAGRDLVQAATAAVLPNTPTFTHVDAGVGSFFTSSTNSVLVVDGYTPLLLDRILVKNQATAANNGIYSVTQLGVAAVTPWILTRTLDYDQPSDMNNTIVPVANNGTTNPKSSWIMTSVVATVDTDAVNFAPFTPNGANIVTASSPGVGLCHFAGGTQACTSSAVVNADIANSTIDLTTKVTGVLPLANGGGITLTSYPVGVNISAGIHAPTSNATIAWSFDILSPVSFSKILLVIHGADTNAGSFNCPNLSGVNQTSVQCYDWGIADSSGVLKADVGPHQVNSPTVADLSIAQGTVTISPGRYFFIITGTAASADLYFTGPSLYFSGACGINESQATSGGQLVSFTPASLSWGQCDWPLIQLHQ